MRLTLRSDLSGFLPPVSAACGGQTIQVRLVPRNRGSSGRTAKAATERDGPAGSRQSQQTTSAAAITEGSIGA